jgi:3-carboxy-cis,cis-muconate cycloisomerase
MDGEILRLIFAPDEFREAVSGRSWLQAMLDAEAALAAAEARAGLIPHKAAATIASCCEATRFDPEELGREGRAAGNPVPPLVKALTEAVSEVSEEAARYVHKGATSQDIVDSAAMLVALRALDLILAQLEGISHACARLAEEHRENIMAGRTLLQQALPTTFGLKAAGWLVSVLEGRRKLLVVAERGLAAQLGGAAGTLASLGESGVSVLGEFTRELDLAEPVVPWHTDRTRIAEIGGALSLLAGVWHAEWEALSEALALTGGAAAAVREVTEGLEVYPEKMRQNLDETGGMLMAENVTTVVSDRLGRLEAHEIVGAASRRVADSGKPFREELLAEPVLRERLSAEEIDAVLDPVGYLGSAGTFIDRALALYREEVPS